MTSSPLSLLISSGNGPAECRIALGHVIQKIREEAEAAGLDLDVSTLSQSDKHGPASAVISLYGPESGALSKRWLGTVQWVCQSPVRPKHRRQNWFVGVFLLEKPQSKAIVLDQTEVRFDTFRAGGPGGQHQNTTDSAVRATHLPSGIAVVVRDQRSQHRNKQVALKRLSEQLMIQQTLTSALARREENLLHHQLERGNPVRQCKGEKFKEF